MKQRTTYALGLLALSAIFLSACAGSGTLTVTDAWARPAAAGNNGAIYFEIDNDSGQDDVLLRVESDAAGLIELHNIVLVDPAELMDEDMDHADMDMGSDEDMGHDDMDHGDMAMADDDMIMQMLPQDSVAVPQGESVLFAPGGLHVMLIGLNNELVEGDSFSATLVFENAGAITVEVSVEQR